MGSVLVARAHIHVENQSRPRHRIGVIAVAGPPRLLGIVADHRSFLMAVERLHRRIDVEYPRLAQKRLHAMVEMTSQPVRARFFLDRRERPPNRVLADDLAHVEKLGQHAVAPQRRDMRVALVPGQHRQHRRPQHVALLGRVRTGVTQRAIRHQRLEQPRGLQKIDEERQLPERRKRRFMIKLDPNRTGETVDHDAHARGVGFNRRLFTRRVSPKAREILSHAYENE